MSSSTSSSRPGTPGLRRALGVTLVVLLALVLLEAVTRVALVPASRDLSRFRTFDARAAALAAAPPPRLALVGNSTTERGIDLDVLRREFAARAGTPLAADMFVADGSGLRTWYWMVSRQFWQPGRRLDLLVASYHAGDLGDAGELDIGRIAQHFSGPEDRHELFAHDLTALTQRVDYLVARRSQLWATRDRLRERVLLLIPGYRRFARELNAAGFAAQLALRREHGDSGATYATLRRFLERARREGTRVCFVAFPTRPPRPGAEPYPLAPEAVQLIAASGMGHLDLRQVEGLAPAGYEDQAHLNAQGRAIYSARLAEALSSAMAPACRLPAAPAPAR